MKNNLGIKNLFGRSQPKTEAQKSVDSKSGVAGRVDGSGGDRPPSTREQLEAHYAVRDMRGRSKKQDLTIQLLEQKLHLEQVNLADPLAVRLNNLKNAPRISINPNSAPAGRAGQNPTIGTLSGAETNLERKKPPLNSSGVISPKAKTQQRLAATPSTKDSSSSSLNGLARTPTSMPKQQAASSKPASKALTGLEARKAAEDKRKARVEANLASLQANVRTLEAANKFLKNNKTR